MHNTTDVEAKKTCVELCTLLMHNTTDARLTGT